ncbi:RNA polymerase sigma factor [Zavarzinella formosa]|uniref:RNA polymerase sigma factor n=1 Tax=Zavarzinella formosa TaxID=360055 RepID=UPI0002F140D5|nr:sigma-70 family RNA polymerase sigma factor [Zavarzinella formosa]
MTSNEIVERLLGLNGHPDPVKAALAKVSIPCGIDPHDVAQHCRIRVMLAAPRYSEDKGTAFTFAFSVALNVAHNHIRDTERKTKRLAPLPRQLNSRPDSRTVPDSRDAVIDRVRTAVRQLPKDLRRVIRLVMLEEVSKPDACKRLGIPMRELNERLNLGKGLLKRILSGKPVKATRRA